MVVLFPMLTTQADYQVIEDRFIEDKFAAGTVTDSASMSSTVNLELDLLRAHYLPRKRPYVNSINNICFKVVIYT
jgi:hypothetical protein